MKTETLVQKVHQATLEEQKLIGKIINISSTIVPFLVAAILTEPIRALEIIARTWSVPTIAVVALSYSSVGLI